MKKPKLLCVDDEPFILSSLVRLLRSDYEVITAESGIAALDIMNQTAGIGVALVDQRMPEMSGVELLERITADYPDTIKIVLTGYTDLGALVDSVNKGEIFRYIQKPWDSAVLKSAIACAYKRYLDHIENRRLKESLSETEEKLKKIMEEVQALRKKLIF